MVVHQGERANASGKVSCPGECSTNFQSKMAISIYAAIKDILGIGAADFVDSAYGEQVCFIDIFQNYLQNIDGQVGGGHQGSSVNSVVINWNIHLNANCHHRLLFPQSTPLNNGKSYGNPKQMQTLSHSHHRQK